MITEELIQFLKASADIFDINDEYNINEYNKLISKVIETGNINIQDENGGTLLMYAASTSYTLFVKILLQAGADINIINSDGTIYTAYDPDGNVNEEIRRMLIENMPDVDIQDETGWTPLMYEVNANRIGNVILLLDKGANINIKDNYGKTAYYIAATKDANSEIRRMLIEKMTDVNIQDEDGWTPLMYEVNANRIGNVILLLNKGADINIKNNNGETAYNIAKAKGLKECLYVLENIEIVNSLCGKSTIDRLIEEDKDKTLDELLEEAKLKLQQYR